MSLLLLNSYVLSVLYFDKRLIDVRRHRKDANISIRFVNVFGAYSLVN
jgi:hypothetical protein